MIVGFVGMVSNDRLGHANSPSVHEQGGTVAGSNPNPRSTVRVSVPFGAQLPVRVIGLFSPFSTGVFRATVAAVVAASTSLAPIEPVTVI